MFGGDRARLPLQHRIEVEGSAETSTDTAIIPADAYQPVSSRGFEAHQWIQRRDLDHKRAWQTAKLRHPASAGEAPAGLCPGNGGRLPCRTHLPLVRARAAHFPGMLFLRVVVLRGSAACFVEDTAPTGIKPVDPATHDTQFAAGLPLKGE